MRMHVCKACRCQPASLNAVLGLHPRDYMCNRLCVVRCSGALTESLRLSGLGAAVLHSFLQAVPWYLSTSGSLHGSWNLWMLTCSLNNKGLVNDSSYCLYSLI